MLTVPNKFPAKQAARRICVIGEAPGTHEVHWHRCLKCGHGFATEWRDQQGHHKVEHCTQCFSREIVADPQPFVGPSGWLLNKLLAEVGIDREACFVGNVVMRQPPGNDISKFKWDGPEFDEGIVQLRNDFAAYQPHFVLLLGNTPLRVFSGDRKRNISDWRGSLFTSGTEVEWQRCVKCLATYHPAALLREAGLTGVARFDFKRAAEECRTDALVVPADNIAINCSREELLLRLSLIKERRLKVAYDIEGWVDFISCIGFATGPNDAFVVPFIKADNTSYWENAEDEVELWEAVAAVLSDPLVPKVAQNSLYDNFVLAWSYGILVRGLVDDIMLKHFELYCELEKSLAFQTSIYTKHPFYKFERKSDDERVQLTYCGKDCCRTYECCEVQEAQLMPKQREHYQMNMKLLAPLLYMELRGIRYDATEAERRLAATTKRIYALQDRINREASVSPDKQALRDFFRCLEAPALRQVEAVSGVNAGDPVEQQVEALGAVAPNIVRILQTAFCLANPGEQREVEEHFYEPQRWNGKRWVKGGKRIGAEQVEAIQACIAQGYWQGSNAPILAETDTGRNRKSKKRLASSDNATALHADGSVVDEGELAKAHCVQGGNGTSGVGVLGQNASDRTQWWLKPGSKRVTKRCKVEVATFEDVRRFAKDSCRADCNKAIQLLRAADKAGGITPAQRGKLATLLGIHVKVNATNAEGDAQWFLYEHCGLPKQFKKENGRLTDKLASDDEAIIKAWVKVPDRRAIWFLNLRQLITSTKSLAAEPDADGRIRCGYNGVGAETHRLTCYGSPTGSSDLNLQTVTKGHRAIYKADEDCWMAQRDLAGADGWTVAAFCAMLGDDTMLRDYQAKLKPAQILVVMSYKGQAFVGSLTRDQLRDHCKPITEENEPRYFYYKRVQHGGCYMMWINTMSDQILTDSFKKTGKPMYVAPRECQKMLESGLFVRYPGIQRWHAWMERELKEKGKLVASDGFQRQFYGRKDDKATVKAALAHLPQYYTTRATMLALMRLWEDAENRRADGSLRVEPLHTVHDSLVTQFRKEELEWARGKLGDYFNNSFLIAQTMVTIPASGTYGESWGEQDNQL